MSPLVLMLSSTAATVAADFSASEAARGGDCGHTCRPPPGFVEADLVAHSGPLTNGAFVQTLVDESHRARRPTRSARAPAVSVTAAAVSAARLRRRQRLRFHERDGSQLLCGRADRADALPAQERFRRTLSRRTARSCGAWSSIGGTRASGSRAAGEALCFRQCRCCNPATCRAHGTRSIRLAASMTACSPPSRCGLCTMERQGRSDGQPCPASARAVIRLPCGNGHQRAAAASPLLTENVRLRGTISNEAIRSLTLMAVRQGVS
jgi:hypothetical protein